MKSDPRNTQVIAYLTRRGAAPGPLTEAPASSPDSYLRRGSHPDVVARLWDAINPCLPRDCRLIFCGTPALVHPDCGVALGLAIGTQYALRLPPEALDEARRAGALTRTRWSGGDDLDTGRDLGSDWVLGVWLEAELEWCRSAYAALAGGAP
jgi:hypothetical protein